MSKCKEVMLKHTEIVYLLEIAEANRDEGVYWGRKDYFMDRQQAVIDKLTRALQTKLK